MKAEGMGRASFERGGVHANAQRPSHRWLADLERAWLDAFGHGAPPAETRAAPPRVCQGSQPAVPGDFPADARTIPGATAAAALQSAMGVQERLGAPADVACGATAMVAAKEPPSSVTASSPTAMTLQTDHSGHHPVQLALSSHTARAPMALASPADCQPGGAQEIEHGPLMPSLSEGKSARLREAAGRVQQGGSPPRPLLASRNFALRLLQVSGERDLQANLRDVTLAAEQQLAVARELFQQLQAAGTPLRRLYINGQRFDHGRTFAVPSESPEQE